MKKFTIFNLALTILLIVQFIFIIEQCSAQWIKYTNPPPGATVNDIVFFDANTGLMAFNDPALYRTTDGGNNWTLLLNMRIYDFQKIDSITAYGVGKPNLADFKIYRTFNKGLNWDSVAITGNAYAGLSFINKDTGWLSGFDGGNYRVFKTTNGGVSVQTLPVIFGQGKIFFLKNKINGEYYGWCEHGYQMYRTTNSGNNWFQVGNAADALNQLTFINENTGWATNGLTSIYKTTNGGVKWDTINMPTFNYTVLNFINRFFVIGNDTLYGDNGTRDFGGGRFKGIIWKSTNGGVNWGFQQPDTSYIYGRYNGIYFIDSITGYTSRLKTTNGGGPVIMSLITSGNIGIPKSFILKQNYPNPFNSQTSIEFSIKKLSYVTFKIYDITGKEVISIFNNLQMSAGSYKTILDFSRVNLSSGVYFCKLVANDNSGSQIFVETKKMVYSK